jgi:hypothetical protein
VRVVDVGHYGSVYVPARHCLCCRPWLREEEWIELESRVWVGSEELIEEEEREEFKINT